DLIGRQLQRLRLPVSVVIQTAPGPRALALTQQLALITCGITNGQSQRIDAQHRALIVQCIRLQMQQAALQRTGL
ncbi:hypothetical protein, partial [Pectobacterium brasiliense]|uniref:hypothetical protein n=1 Tax=Pectobacterium brasiliense TaxID=180957 RepID=UPI001968AF8E